MPEGFDEPFEIKSPYAMLYHHWDNLHDYRKTLTDKVDLAHLDLLLEFMRLEMGKQRVDVSHNFQNTLSHADPGSSFSYRSDPVLLVTVLDHINLNSSGVLRP